MNELDLLIAIKSYIEASEETIASLSGDDRPGIKRDVIGSMPPLYAEVQRRLLAAQAAANDAAAT